MINDYMPLTPVGAGKAIFNIQADSILQNLHGMHETK